MVLPPSVFNMVPQLLSRLETLGHREGAFCSSTVILRFLVHENGHVLFQSDLVIESREQDAAMDTVVLPAAACQT